MSQRTKLILGLVALFGSAALIGFLLYLLMIRTVPTIEEETGAEAIVPGGLTPSASGELIIPEGEEGLPTTGETVTGVLEGALTIQLTSSAITSPTLTSNGAIAYYDPSDGRFYTIDRNGNVLPLSETQLIGAESVIFSDDAGLAAVEFPDGSNIIYDFATGSQTNLPDHWEDFDFSPDGESVASKSLNTDPDSRALVITSSDGTSTRAIAALGTNEDLVTLDWSPNDQIVGFSETGDAQTGFGRSQIYLIDTDGEAIGAIVVEGTNFSSIWSPSGSYLLYSVADAGNYYRPSLWYVNATGGSIGTGRTKFDVETWVEKCTFADETTVYCAVPREVPNYSGEDGRLVSAPDDLYKINVTSGRVTFVASPAIDMQMFNLSISPDGNTLYFTDDFGRLNAIEI